MLDSVGRAMLALTFGSDGALPPNRFWGADAWRLIRQMALCLPWPGRHQPSFLRTTRLQAVPSDADELAVLATATARVGHFGVDLRDNLHLTSDRLRVVFWQTGAALFHCRYSFAQACESLPGVGSFWNACALSYPCLHVLLACYRGSIPSAGGNLRPP